MSTVENASLNLLPITNPVVSIFPHSSDTTEAISLEIESLSLIVLPRGWEFKAGRRLNSILLVQVRASRNGVLAITYLEAEEYGWGMSEHEAVMDLMSSLVEYMESLESRQDRLAEPALADLRKLQQLFLR